MLKFHMSSLHYIYLIFFTFNTVIVNALTRFQDMLQRRHGGKVFFYHFFALSYDHLSCDMIMHYVSGCFMSF
jgi:hypothetical protein